MCKDESDWIVMTFCKLSLLPGVPVRVHPQCLGYSLLKLEISDMAFARP
jgi:hypothetical protein